MTTHFICFEPTPPFQSDICGSASLIGWAFQYSAASRPLGLQETLQAVLKCGAYGKCGVGTLSGKDAFTPIWGMARMQREIGGVDDDKAPAWRQRAGVVPKNERVKS